MYLVIKFKTPHLSASWCDPRWAAWAHSWTRAEFSISNTSEKLGLKENKVVHRLPVGVIQSCPIAISSDIAIAAGFHVLKIFREWDEAAIQFVCAQWQHWNKTGQDSGGISIHGDIETPSENSPEYLACGNPAWAQGLDKVASRSPFHLSCSVSLWSFWSQSPQYRKSTNPGTVGLVRQNVDFGGKPHLRNQNPQHSPLLFFFFFLCLNSLSLYLWW